MTLENQETLRFEHLPLDDEGLQILEFPEVKARAANFCALYAAKDRILNTKPSHSLTDIKTHQQETREARVFLESHGTLAVSYTHLTLPTKA